jgi:carbonic anhydrase
MFCKLSNLITVFTVCLLSVDGLRVDQKCVPPAQWDYGTPIVWGNYDLCTCGTHQSPIDLPKTIAAGDVGSDNFFAKMKYSANA